MPQAPPTSSANGVVESLMESFCQCFGTESQLTTRQRQVDDDDVIAAPSTPPRNSNDFSSVPTTPERQQKRPNNLFMLQQKGKAQWNSFFFGQQAAPTTPQGTSLYDKNNNVTSVVTPPQPEFTSSTVTATSRRNRSKPHGSNTNTASRNNTTITSSIEQKSRSSSKSSSPKSQQNRKGLTKRKRTASRDDIFRSKRDQQQAHVRQHSSQFNNTAPSSNNMNNLNPFLSRFLSGSSPVCMATLCFATPIRGDSSFEDNELNNNTIGDDDDEDDAASNNNSTSYANGKNNMNGTHNDVASVVSDSNTLNTAEDTITSTLYYETTKLAGLKQTNPLMPLYNSHAVGDAKDDIHQIVHFRTQQQQLQNHPIVLTNRTPPQHYVPSIPSPHQVLQENNMDDDEDDDVEDNSDDEQKHIYTTNESSDAKPQTPLTPTKKAAFSGSTAQHGSPVRIVARAGHYVSSSNGAATPTQSPLPPVSKLSSDSSKS